MNRSVTHPVRTGLAATLAATACLVLSFSAAAVPSGSQPEDPKSRTSTGRVMANPMPSDAQHVGAQAPESTLTPDDALSVVADHLYSLGAESGFAGMKLDRDELAITLSWKGPTPTSVSDYLTHAAKLGIAVKVNTSAAYTRAEEQRAAELVSSSPLVKSAGVASVASRSDGQGIVIHLVADLPDLKTQADLAATAGLPVAAITYVPDDGSIVPLAGSRNNDVAPWKGGARTIQHGEGCSTAFAALAGTSGRLLSANHCDPPASHQVTDGAGNVIATAANVVGKPSIDSQSIDPTASPATTPRIFTGDWNSTTTAVVKNWASNWVGDEVCAGGAATGRHCGTIVDDSVTYPGYTGTWYVRARATSGAMAGGSDSGGPVYRGVSGGVQARGVILGGYNATAAPCGTHNPDVPDLTCFRDIIYSPISVVLNAWGYALEVG